MIRKSLVVAFTALLIAFVVIQAQDDTRRLELRVVSASRGYMRPLRTTAERVKALPGLEETVAIGARAGMMRFALKTKLTDAQIAEAMGMEIVDAKKGQLLLAPPGDPQAFRAEARQAILAIADALHEKRPGPEGNVAYSGNDGGPVERTSLTGSIEQRMKALGLDPKILDGKTYKAKDYHIEWRGDFYQIFAGTKWEGLAVGRDNDYPDWSGGDESEALEPDPKSMFVGAKLQVSDWNAGFWWADLHGLALNESTVGRDAAYGGDRGKLLVQRGGERLVDFLQKAAKFRFEGENAKKTVEQLPKGNIGTNRKIAQAFRKEEDEDYYYEQYYGNHTMTLTWFKDEAGHTRARIKAYHTRHTLHLDGDLDCDAAKDADFDFNKVEVHWVVAPETEAGVFERRRAEVVKGFDRIREALFAMDALALAELRKSAVSGDAMLTALKLKAEDLKGEFFSAADYVVKPQMLGDFEIFAGSPLVGCESWTLLNLTDKTVIRSNQ